MASGPVPIVSEAVAGLAGGGGGLPFNVMNITEIMALPTGLLRGDRPPRSSLWGGTGLWTHCWANLEKIKQQQQQKLQQNINATERLVQNSNLEHVWWVQQLMVLGNTKNHATLLYFNSVIRKLWNWCMAPPAGRRCGAWGPGAPTPRRTTEDIHTHKLESSQDCADTQGLWSVVKEKSFGSFKLSTLAVSNNIYIRLTNPLSQVNDYQQYIVWLCIKVHS